MFLKLLSLNSCAHASVKEYNALVHLSIQICCNLIRMRGLACSDLCSQRLDVAGIFNIQPAHINQLLPRLRRDMVLTISAFHLCLNALQEGVLLVRTDVLE